MSRAVNIVKERSELSMQIQYILQCSDLLSKHGNSNMQNKASGHTRDAQLFSENMLRSSEPEAAGSAGTGQDP